jgi:hypothetical protein
VDFLSAPFASSFFPSSFFLRLNETLQNQKWNGIVRTKEVALLISFSTETSNEASTAYLSCIVQRHGALRTQRPYILN